MRTSAWIAVLRVTLGAALATFGIAKVVSGHDASYVLGPLSYHLVAALELVAGVLLLAGRACSHACWFAILIAVGGASVGVLHADRSCGCLGVWAHLTPRAHLGLAGVLGIAALMVLRGCSRARSAPAL